MKVRLIACLIALFVLAVSTNSYAVAGGGAEAKFQNFVILLDQSSEMNVTYHNQSLNYLARDITKKLIRAIPTDIPLTGAIYVYGVMAAENENRVQRIQNWKPFNTREFVESLKEEAKPQAGPSSLSVAFRHLRRDMKEQKITGKTAVILISGGNFTDVGEPTTEYKNLRKEFGNDKICLFTILVGTSERGGKFLDELSDKGKCGFSTSADSISREHKLNRYVKKVFYKKVTDEDGDGVPDGQDQCPNTPFGADVDSRGCWSINNINFDSGKSVIKSMYFAQLDEIASIMNANPSMRVTIIGHTDSDGDEAYNQKLSEQRAQAVMQYLVSAGVNASRLSAKGMGEGSPIADNGSSSGKALNRRIEFSYVN